MISLVPQYLDRAISTLVPAVFMVLKKMKLPAYEMIMGIRFHMHLRAGVLTPTHPEAIESMATNARARTNILCANEQPPGRLRLPYKPVRGKRPGTRPCHSTNTSAVHFLTVPFVAGMNQHPSIASWRSQWRSGSIIGKP